MKFRDTADRTRTGLVIEPSARYNNLAPFNPRLQYPEYQFSEIDTTSDSNSTPDAYSLLRNVLFELGLDADHFDTKEWNPLGEIIQPGDFVVLKPNWVINAHPRGCDIFSVITHPSLIRAALDFVLIALAGQGAVSVCDAPQADCDFAALSALSQLDALREFYERQPGLTPSFVDLRKIQFNPDADGYLKEDSRTELAGDPRGYHLVNLGKESLLFDLENLENLYGADYDRSFTTTHHKGERQEYLVSGSALAADVVISLPKIKAHKKTGVTLNLKNLVGINGDKNYLAHYRVGASDAGGDEYPAELPGKQKLVLRGQRALIDKLLARPSRMSTLLFDVISRLYRIFRKASRMDLAPRVRQGDWHGNDTAWRMVIDLNRILFLADTSGKMQDAPQRKYFSILDGIVCGEGDGPLNPDPKQVGMLLCGFSPTPVDLTATLLMGFDYRKLRLYDYIVGEVDRGRNVPYVVNDIGAITVGYQGANYSLDELAQVVAPLNFRPHYGWRGKVERSSSAKILDKESLINE